MFVFIYKKVELFFMVLCEYWRTEMKKIELLNDGKSIIYLKIRELEDVSIDLRNDILNNTDKPYIAFNFGVIVNTKTWVGFDATFCGEDGFVLCGKECEELIKFLKDTTDNTKENEITIYDCFGDTDANINIKVERDKVSVSGCLGESYTWESGINAPILKFSIETTSEILSNLYNVLKDNIII